MKSLPLFSPRAVLSAALPAGTGAAKTGQISFAKLLGAEAAKPRLATASFAAAPAASRTGDAPLVRPRAAPAAPAKRGGAGLGPRASGLGSDATVEAAALMGAAMPAPVAPTLPGRTATRPLARAGAPHQVTPQSFRLAETKQSDAWVAPIVRGAETMAAVAGVTPRKRSVAAGASARVTVARGGGEKREGAQPTQESKRVGELHPVLLPSAGVLDHKIEARSHGAEAKKAGKIEGREPAREPERAAATPPPPVAVAESRRPAQEVVTADGSPIAPQGDGPVVAFAPPMAASLVEQAAADPGLQLGILPHAAHMSIESPEGNLALHVRVRDGAAEIRIAGNMAPLFEARAPEIQSALAGEGLSLGRFDLDDQRGGGQPPPEEPGVDDAAPVSPAPRRANETEVVVRDGRIHVKA
jgi:hypothetical protein